MEITVEHNGYVQSFQTSLAGVTKENNDGSKRQDILKNSKVGQSLKLIREPNNPHDKYAVAVYNSSEQQLGYVPEGDSLLASHMDMGGPVTAQIKYITGGPGLLGMLHKSMRKNYGCVIEINKHDFNWKEVSPYRDKDREIEQLLEKAKKKEATNPTKAIEMYREAITQITELDGLGSVAAAWRCARYPINRLSLVLEKEGDKQSAYDEILQYEKFDDYRGLNASDYRSIESRKNRLKKSLGF